MDYDLHIKVLNALVNYMFHDIYSNNDTVFNNMDVEAVELSIQAIKKLRQIESVECELPGKTNLSLADREDYDFSAGYNYAIDECEPIIRKQALEIEKLKQRITELENILDGCGMGADFTSLYDHI
jgi:hypothetical protein